MSKYGEYFLNSNSNIVELELIELSHPNFTTTYYLVRNAIDGIVVILETSVSQEFIYYPLQITPSGSGDDLDQLIKVQLGDLGEVLPQELDSIFINNGFDVKPTLIYRTYRSDDLTTPLLGPLTFKVNNITFNETGAVLEASAPKLNSSGTGEFYTTNRFPMLRGFI
jgi:hypothetical protein